MDSSTRSLFRSEALHAARARDLGGIFIVVSPSFRILSLAAALFALAICTFLALGSYTRRSTIIGQVASDAGVIKIYAQQSGLVLERHVSEGAVVKAGDVLFVVSSDRYGPSEGSVQAAISRKVQERQASVSSEIDKLQALHGEERRSLQRKVSGLQDESQKLATMAKDQTERVQLANDNLSRYRSLRDRQLISAEQFQQKTAEMLDQRTRLQGMERDQLVLGSAIVAGQAELESLELRHQTQLAQIGRLLTMTSQEFVESESKRRLIIQTPLDGIATALVVNVGQVVDSAVPMVSIVPAGSILKAELFAPSRDVGLIRPGDAVRIRYEAFPYEQFGHHMGIVTSVAKTAVSPAELSATGFWLDSTDNQPRYRITVKLLTQSVITHGQRQALQPGMLLNADVLIEKRHLYEWLLDPLHRLSDKL